VPDGILVPLASAYIDLNTIPMQYVSGTMFVL